MCYTSSVTDQFAPRSACDRQRHKLVTHGTYLHVRHPMYLALLLYSSGQALVLSNWVAGPSYLVALALLFALRVGPDDIECCSRGAVNPGISSVRIDNGEIG